MSTAATVLLAVRDRDLQAHLMRVIEDEGFQAVGAVEDPVEAVQLAIAYRPAVVVVDDCPPLAWAQVCSYLRLAAPESSVILVTEQVTEQTVQSAMLLGVRQVLSRVEAAALLPAIIEKLRDLEEMRLSEAFTRATDPQLCARLVSISGAKGGVGKTTLAANLGETLASMNVGPVLVWDAYCQFGDIASIMAISGARPLSDLTDMGEDVDDDMILSCAVQHPSGAAVLLTSDKPVPFESFSEAFVDRVIKAVRSRYRFIVVDTAPILHPMSNIIFARSWQVLLVTTLKDVTSISDGLKLLQLLEPKYVRREAVRIVANRVAKGDSVREKEVESLTGKPLAAVIPEDPSVGQANNLGASILQVSPKGPAARAITQLAEALVESAATFVSEKRCPAV